MGGMKDLCITDGSAAGGGNATCTTRQTDLCPGAAEIGSIDYAVLLSLSFSPTGMLVLHTCTCL